MKTVQELAAAIKKESDAKFPILYEVFSSVDRRIVKNGCGELEEEVFKCQDTDKSRYDQIKEYFLKKAKEFEPEELLINFDDNAQRIDIGYGKKELQCIFPGLLWILYESGALGSGISALSLDWKHMNGCLTKWYRNEKDEIEKNYFATNPTSDAAAKRSPISLPKIKTDTNIIIECLRNHNGIAVGEIHEHKSPKLFLIKNFELLKSQGVTTLYMEHLLDSHQDLLDTYMKAPENAPMPKRLAAYLRMLDSEFLELKSGHSEEGTFSNLIVQAKKAGIRVIAIDTEVAYEQGVVNDFIDLYNEQERSIKRNKALHVSALQKFKEFDDRNKYIFFTGNGHVTRRYNVLGLSELFGIPNIVVHDTTQILETCTQNASYEGLTFDILLERRNFYIDLQRLGVVCFIGAIAMSLPYVSTFIYKPLVPAPPKAMMTASLITGLLACACTNLVQGRE